jgi:hypothetical protein
MESAPNESESDNKGLLIILNGINRFFGEITKENKNKKFEIKDKRNDEIFGTDADLFAGYIQGMIQIFEVDYKIKHISKIFWIKNNKLNFLANINMFANKNGTFIWVNCLDKKINSNLAQEINDNIKNIEDVKSIYGKIKETLDKSGEELFFKNKKTAISNRFKNNVFQKTDDENSMNGIICLLNDLFNKDEFIILDNSGNQYYFSAKMNDLWNLFKECLEKIKINENINHKIIGINSLLKLIMKKSNNLKDAFFETIEGRLKGIAKNYENPNFRYYSMLADIKENFPAKYKTLLEPEILHSKELLKQIENYKYSQDSYGPYLKIVNNLKYFGISQNFPFLADFESNFEKLAEISASGESGIKIFSKKNIELFKRLDDKKYSHYIDSRKKEIDKIKKILGFSEHLKDVKETVDSIKK